MEPWSRCRQVEVPQIQYEDQVVQVPIQKQVQVPHVQTVQKTVEIPQIELLALNNLKYLGVLSVVGMHLLRALRVFLSALVLKVAPHLRYVDKVVPIPVAKQVHVPMVSTVTGLGFIGCTQCFLTDTPVRSLARYDDSKIAQITHRDRPPKEVLQRCRTKLSVPLCSLTLLDDPLQQYHRKSRGAENSWSSPDRIYWCLFASPALTWHQYKSLKVDVYSAVYAFWIIWRRRTFVRRTLHPAVLLPINNQLDLRTTMSTSPYKSIAMSQSMCPWRSLWRHEIACGRS